MLGYAATTDVKDVPVVVADGDRTAASRELIARFDASPNFTIVDTVTTVSEIEPYLERGTAWLALAIPAGYGSDVGAAAPVTVQVVADGTDSNSTTSRSATRHEPDRRLRAGAGAAAAHGTGPGRPSRRHRRADPRLVQPAAREPLLHDSRRARADPADRHRQPRVDGDRAREGAGHARAAQRHAARRWELIVGKLLPYGLIGWSTSLLVVAVAVFWFEVPLRGSFALLFAMSLLYVLCTLALGLFISTISDTQQQAMMTATFFFLTPMIYLSGFIFPIENMPAVIQPLFSPLFFCLPLFGICLEVFS